MTTCEDVYFAVSIGPSPLVDYVMSRDHVTANTARRKADDGDWWCTSQSLTASTRADTTMAICGNAVPLSLS